jgi:NhaP-type Na+/H+ or K+/H+ antiporter
MSTDRVLAGIGLILVLAVGSQVRASRLRIPALMTGAILVVSRPTVVGPLLAFVRPSDRLQRILSWEAR